MYYVRFFLKGHEGTKRSTYVYNKYRVNKEYGIMLKKTVQDSHYPLSRCPRVDCKELNPSYHTALEIMRNKRNRNSPETVEEFVKIMTKTPQGRLPEGTLNFHEVKEADESNTAASRIYSDFVRETQGVFDKKESGKIACEEAQKIAEHMNRNITDKVQNKLMTDITMWTLVFGSCLDAYGLLDEVKSESELWETVKGELKSTRGKSTASRTSGTWTCK